MKQGNIGVTSENIFPVIKKFLYSDHEIFLREIVSNAVDATQKLKTLASVGEFKGEIGEAVGGHFSALLRDEKTLCRRESFFGVAPRLLGGALV